MSESVDTVVTERPKKSSSVALLSDRINAFVIPMKRMIARAQGAFSSISSRNDDGPDFGRIVDYCELESTINLAVIRHVEQIVKAGWTLQSKNPAASRYVAGRLYEMGQRMKEPFEVTLHQFVDSCVRFNNGLLYLNRSERLSPGRPIAKTQGSDKLAPIAGLEVLPLHLSRPKIDDRSNRVSKWKFSDSRAGMFNRKEMEISEANVLHCYVGRQPGEIYALPWLMTVLDDIQDLRTVEAVINSIISQQGAPLIHIKIENPTVDLETGVSEIDVVHTKVRAGGLESGVYISDARHTIEVVSNAAQLNAYQWAIDHYRRRVREGCNLSDIDLGSGASANRNTASSLTDKGIDRCVFFATTIELFLNLLLIDPLLMESASGLAWDEKDDTNRVQLRFNEIDVDRKMRREVHAQMLWESAGLSHAEFRQRIGEEPFSEEQWDDSYIERYLVRQIEAKADAAPAAGGGADRSGSRAKQNMRGTNQYGNNPVPKVAKNSSLVHKLSVEALEHYRAGLALTGRAAEIHNEAEADAAFRIGERVARMESFIEDTPGEDASMAAVHVGNLVRSQAYLQGAGDLKAETAQ